MVDLPSIAELGPDAVALAKAAQQTNHVLRSVGRLHGLGIENGDK